MLKIDKWKLSQNIEAAIRDLDMTYDEICLKANMYPKNISKWVNCAAVPSAINLIKLSRVTGVSMDKLLEGVAVDE